MIQLHFVGFAAATAMMVAAAIVIECPLLVHFECALQDTLSIITTRWNNRFISFYLQLLSLISRICGSKCIESMIPGQCIHFLMSVVWL